MLILFCIFAQTDSVKVDTTKIQQAQSMHKDLDNTNSKLDSIIAILKKDTIKNKMEIKERITRAEFFLADINTNLL